LVFVTMTVAPPSGSPRSDTTLPLITAAFCATSGAEATVSQTRVVPPRKSEPNREWFICFLKVRDGR
jgi:hypothetical protein